MSVNKHVPLPETTAVLIFFYSKSRKKSRTIIQQFTPFSVPADIAETTCFSTTNIFKLKQH